jgi:outer membrane protein OmpA-like peptidoglycan-associated protein
MSLFSRRAAKLASVAAFVLLAGCAQQAPPAQPVARYNPPGNALAQLPPANVTWYHVMFANNSYLVDAAGQQAIENVADSMQGNSGLTATVIGKTDAVGGDAANMRLSEKRANAVRMALLQTGKVPADRIETRWTGDRQPGAAPMGDVADAGNRAVDIGVH